MIERQIIQAVYSPFKAFESIVKNPVSRGPVIIIVLGVVAAAISGLVSYSKVEVQLESETGPYVPLLTTNVFGGRMLSVLIDQALMLAMTWLIYTAMIILVTKAFRVKEGSWRTLFYVIGYTLITSVVSTLITALLISPLPTVRLAWGWWNPTQELDEAARQGILKAYETWFSSPSFQVLNYLPFIVQGWAAALVAIAIRALLGVSWNKAVAISAIASVLAFMMRLTFFYA